MKKNIILLLFISLFCVSCIKDFEETTAYPYKVGDVFSEGGVMGLVVKISDDGLHGMIVSLNEFECAWGDTLKMNTNDTINGLINMVKIKTSVDWQTKFPAFYWCDCKNGEGVSGWYLPAKNEMEEIMSQRMELNKVLEEIGSQTMFGKMYWTSTEYGKYEAYHANFIRGEMENYAMKNNKKTLFVRAIKEF